MYFVTDLTAQNKCIELEFSNIQTLYSNVSNPLVVNEINDLFGYKISNSGTLIKFKFARKNELLAIPQRPTNRKGCSVFIINPAGDTVLTKNIKIKKITGSFCLFFKSKKRFD